MNINTIDLNQADGPFGKLSPFYQNLNPTIVTDKDSSKEDESANLLTYVYAGIITSHAFRKRVFGRDPHNAKHDAYTIFADELDENASDAARIVIEGIYTENSEELKALFRTGKRTILYNFSTQMIFAKNNILGQALMSHREKMRRTLREKLTLQKDQDDKVILNDTLTAYYFLRGLARNGNNLFERGYKNVRASDIAKQSGARTSIDSIDELPDILQRVVRAHPRYDGILAELVMATDFNNEELDYSNRGLVKAAYYHSILKGSTEEKKKQRYEMEEKLLSSGETMDEFEKKLMWFFKKGQILTDRSMLSANVQAGLNKILKDGEPQWEKSVDNIFANFKNDSSSKSSSITIADLDGDGDDGDGDGDDGDDVILNTADLPVMLFKEMYAILYSKFKIQDKDDKSSKLKVGVSIQDAYKLMSSFSTAPNGAPFINDLQRTFEEIIVEYIQLIMEKRCEVALRMIYKDPNGEMARLLATVGQRRLVLDIPESPDLSFFIISMMNKIRHSESFVENVVPLTRLDYVRNDPANMGITKEKKKMADIFKGDELDWILSKIDDVVYGVKRFKEYKKRKFGANNIDDDDIKCVLAMYANCVSCAMTKMTTHRRKKLLSHKNVPSDFSEKYRGVVSSRKGTTMLWNYALILHNMLKDLKETLKEKGLVLSIEKMTKIASALSNQERPDVKMAVINLLETINSHMTKRVASFEIDKFDVDLVYQIISVSKDHLPHDQPKVFGNRSFGGTGAGAGARGAAWLEDAGAGAFLEDTGAAMRDSYLIKTYVSRFVDANVSVEEKEMRAAKLAKHIIDATYRMSRIEMSRINMFASCEKDDESDDEVDDKDESDNESDKSDSENSDLDDFFENEEVGVITNQNENIYGDDEDIRHIAFNGEDVGKRVVREIDPEDDEEDENGGNGKKKSIHDVGGESDDEDDEDDESDGEGYDYEEIVDDDE